MKDHLSRGLGHPKHFRSYRLTKPSVTYLSEHSYGESPLIRFVSRLAIKEAFCTFATKGNRSVIKS